MSDAFPEPTDVGPIAGGAMRASDRDRDLVTQVLNTAYTDGRLTRQELDERLDQAMNAKTFDDLVPLTRDLVPAGGFPHQAVATSRPAADAGSGPRIDTSHVNDAPERFIGILGGVDRKGRIRVRKRNEFFALLGGVDLDWTDAIFEDQIIEMRGIACLGGLDIRVPEGVNVRNEMVGILGGVDVKVPTGDPHGPTIVLKGVALLGGVDVKGPKRTRRRRHASGHQRGPAAG